MELKFEVRGVPEGMPVCPACRKHCWYYVNVHGNKKSRAELVLASKPLPKLPRVGDDDDDELYEEPEPRQAPK